ncbi:Hypothetical predicted protein [Podarcis lilfordi]|uniref:Uncharacterized protein n=1 Tax=Podarcis lilfordi TaxID=74358 RepID=A0AA35KVW8_9SAUR|nr:Hypothetical predicted protein [Podarcis lilfordi]
MSPGCSASSAGARLPCAGSRSPRPPPGVAPGERASPSLLSRGGEERREKGRKCKQEPEESERASACRLLSHAREFAGSACASSVCCCCCCRLCALNSARLGSIHSLELDLDFQTP